MFENSWQSLQNRTTVQWLRKAKFGIYTHWGIYSVHEKGGNGNNVTWYANNLYEGNKEALETHRRAFGELKDFGYTDFIPMFKAEKFDADEWAELFGKAGARFAGPVGEHHDGFSMWNSKVNPVNSVNYGPKRDVVGELEKAVKANGMKFMVAMHHAENYWFLKRVEGTDSCLKKEFDGMFSKLDKMSQKEFADIWWAKLKEVIDFYSPDLLWFDFGLKDIPESYKLNFMQYFLNDGIKKGQERQVVYKHFDLGFNSALLDLELGRYDTSQYHEWITDTTIDDNGSWGCFERATYKSATTLIHYLINNVAFNGYLLLNIGPKADGTIPEEVQKRLIEMGKWLLVNGEAIYDTVPWIYPTEGEVRLGRPGEFCENELQYTAKDIRYTNKADALYAMVLGKPDSEVILNGVLAGLLPEEIKDIQILGCDEKLNYKICPAPRQPLSGQVKIKIPSNYCFKHALTIKITKKKI